MDSAGQDHTGWSRVGLSRNEAVRKGLDKRRRDYPVADGRDAQRADRLGGHGLHFERVAVVVDGCGMEMVMMVMTFFRPSRRIGSYIGRSALKGPASRRQPAF
jgi:hypothetical protein